MAENNKHPKNVAGYNGSLQELAHATGCMRYDKVAEFIQAFAVDIESQAEADLKIRDRKKLSQELFEAAQFLDKAKAKMDSAWKICKQFMKEDE